MWKTIRKTVWVFVVAGLMATPAALWGEEAPELKKLTLVKAVMCESIVEYAPMNTAVVFSIERGRISCFTEFDLVPHKTYIHHK